MTRSKKQSKILGYILPSYLSFIFIIAILAGMAVFLLIQVHLFSQEINRLQDIPPAPKRIGPIEARGIYITSWTAGQEERIDELIDLVLKTKLNSVVIDIKDDSGRIGYWSEIPEAIKYGTREKRIKDIDELLKKLHRHSIYTIARIVVFQDPVLAKERPDLALKDRRTGEIWRDFKGHGWVDPASEEVWDYNIALAGEAFELGFDEVNFDYIRFPSDGLTRYISYPIWDGKIPKYEIVRDFFKYQKEKLAGLGPRSIDLFGLTFWHLDDETYDMNIGQRLIDALDYFDYICPMLYPSHFPDNFEGFANPAEYPYEIISGSLKNAQLLLINPEKKKLPKARPWLQAFDLGAKYTPEMILSQIQATLDGGGYGWLFWNARNDYSNVESALKGFVQNYKAKP